MKEEKEESVEERDREREGEGGRGRERVTERNSATERGEGHGGRRGGDSQTDGETDQ